MKTKLELLSLIIMTFMAIGFLVVGVWSVTQTNFEVSGSIEYTAPEIFEDGLDASEYTKLTFTNYDSTNMTVSVKKKSNSVTIGDVVIPSKVKYNDEIYTVTAIGGGVVFGGFSSCSKMTSITIPNTVTGIGNRAFYRTGLVSIEIPNSVTSIGDEVFEYCSELTAIKIPDSVTSIGDCPLFGCVKITSIKVDSNNKIYDSRNNCNAIIETSTNSLIQGCNYTVIPKSVTYIGLAAFGGYDMTSIEIPESVYYIGEQAFNYCTGLTSITIPDSVTSIGSSAFYNCTGLTSVTIGSGVTSIGADAFCVCSSLTSIVIPDSVKSISSSSFKSCSGLESIVVDSNNTVYDSRNNCNAIIKTSTNTLISGCSSSTIPDSVTSIGDYAFYNCTGLTSITIPSSITSIGAYAFYNCSSLTSVTFKNTSGWWVSTSSSATSGDSVTVTSATTNATNLVSTYYNYYWKRG